MLKFDSLDVETTHRRLFFSLTEKSLKRFKKEIVDKC